MALSAGDLKLRRAELRQRKAEARHQATLDYVDRGLSLVRPVVTSPVVMFLGAMVAADWIGHQKDVAIPQGPGFTGWVKETLSDIWIGGEVGTMKAAIMAGFIGNAFGGPAGISQIIGAARK